jgi:sulfur transfer complex TusBCD TusB component (DsrH family)
MGTNRRSTSELYIPVIKPPPLKEVVNLKKINELVKAFTPSDVITALLKKDVVVWPLPFRGLYVSQDYETKHRNSVWASQLGLNDIITYFIHTKYGVKLYREEDLYRILYGLLVHEAYEGILRLTMEEVEAEVKVYDLELRVVGVADLVVNDAVIEIKSGKSSPRHRLQLTAYMKALNKQRGFLVYQDSVFEIVINSDVLKELRDAVNRLRQLREELSLLSLEDVVKRYPNAISKFQYRYGVELIELIKVLESEGFTRPK